MRWTLTGAHLVDADGEQPGGNITVDGGRISAAGRGGGEEGVRIPVRGLFVLPGFVDVHTHGGGGFDLHTSDPAEIQAYAAWAPRAGTMSFLAGVVGVRDALPEAQLRAAAQACAASGKDGAPAAEALGIHLEGPYINPAKRGAHAISWLRVPNPADTERLLELGGGWLRLVAMAPELPDAEAMIRRLVAARVHVSIAHTEATYDQARAGIAWGMTHATHCFNAMPPLLHRAPGPLGAIVEAPQVLAELIGDGHHVLPAAMRVLLRSVGPERIVIVTDSLALAGLSGGTYTFGGQELHMEGGVARLPDGTISGSVLTLDQALRNLVRWFDTPLPHAVRMLSTNPARAAGAADRKGRLLPGYDADLLLYDEGLNLQAAICRGRVAYAEKEWSERLSALPS